MSIPKKPKTKTTKKTSPRVRKISIEKPKKSPKQPKKSPGRPTLKINIYNKQGKVIEQKKLDSKIFGVEPKKEVIHQVVTFMLSSQRHPWAHAKARSEKRGGGRKPWRQKGTGRARAGSIRSPIWRGGGVTFGPRKERNYYKKINKKVRKKALLMCLSDKVKENKMYVLDKLTMPEIKTKKFNAIITKLIKPSTKKTKKKPKVLVSLADKDLNVIKSAKNIPEVKTIRAIDLNVLDVLRTDYLITTKKGVEKIQKHFGLGT